jgi:TatD DNase family protein
MIDSHAHIHDSAFDADRDAVMGRARDAGISTTVTVGCDLEDSRRAIETARRYGIAASVGIHPHEAKLAPADLVAALTPLLDESRVVAIGETGLDFFYDRSPREEQERVLRSQIRTARDRGLPVIFHVRDAHERMLEILREEFMPEMRGVIHCFTGSAEDARRYTGEFGLFLGIGGIVTFKNATPLREAAAAAGVAALLLETDCPYLAPIPMRGKRNEPAFMAHTAECLAQALGIEPSALAAATDRNASELFNLPV